MNIFRALARPMLAAPFILAGMDAINRPELHRDRARVAEPALNALGIKELPNETIDLATRGLGAAFVAAGTGFTFGIMPRACATTLAALQIPVAIANNPFWKPDRNRSDDRLGLASSLGLAAGAIFAAVDRRGKPSLAWRIQQERSQA